MAGQSYTTAVTMSRAIPAPGPPRIQGLPLAPPRARLLLRPRGTSRACASGSRKRRERDPREPGEPGRITPGRVLKWVALAVGGWLLLSLRAVHAQRPARGGRLGARPRRALPAAAACSPAARSWCSAPTSARATRPTSARPGPARADTILLLRAASAACASCRSRATRRPRSPGTAPRRSTPPTRSAAPALMIETVENFLGNGLEINHLVEVDFENFPELIDALGGHHRDHQEPRSARRRSATSRAGFNFKKGENEVNGAQALGFARVRKNPAPRRRTTSTARRASRRCSSAISGKAFSPTTFFRLPLGGLAGAEDDQDRPGGPGPAGARRRHGHRRLRRDPRARSRRAWAAAPGRQPGGLRGREDRRRWTSCWAIGLEDPTSRTSWSSVFESDFESDSTPSVGRVARPTSLASDSRRPTSSCRSRSCRSPSP